MGYVTDDEVWGDTERHREHIYEENNINIRNMDEGIPSDSLNYTPLLPRLITLKGF